MGKSFLSTLVDVVNGLISFITRFVFWAWRMIYGFMAFILEMILDILVAIDFTGILADLFDRKDKV
jgi:hypothetical protein